MISTYNLIENQLKQLDFLQNDLQVHCERISDDRLYLEHEAEMHDENGNYEESEKYYNELDLLVYPIRKLESEIRQVKASIVEDYSELILTCTGDVSLANSIYKSRKNAVQTDNIITALKKNFNI